MDDMKELIDEKTVELIINTVAIGGPIVGLMVGAVLGAVTKRWARSLLNGLGAGSLGVLIFGLWRYYSWTVRYDPKTGYVGLHKVSVLLTNVVVFLVIGVLLGLFVTHVWTPMVNNLEGARSLPAAERALDSELADPAKTT